MRLFWFGLIWLAGIAMGRFLALSAGSFLIAGILGLLLAIVGENSLRKIGVGVTIFFLGAWRLAIAVPEFDGSHVSVHNDTFRIATLTGIVSDYPDVRDEYVGLRVSTDSIRYSDSKIPLTTIGDALVRAERFSSFSYGDRVEAVGILETPPEFEDFSYRDYLARQGIFSLMSNASVTTQETRSGNPFLQALFNLRQEGLETLYSIFPDPEASLLAGILLGIDSGISSEVRNAFNDTSTTHIIAISGFNITILAAMVITLTGRTLGMRKGAIAAAIVISLYTILVGADAAVVRAAIMGGLALFARYLGRVTLALASLSAAAILMTLANPYVLWDVGFQLSFAATLGLVLYAEPIKDWFVRVTSRWIAAGQAKRLSSPVGEFILFTFAAQITTLPLTAYHFQRLSLVSFIANPIVLPAQPPLMMLGGLAVIAGMVWLPLGQLLAWLAWPFPAFTIRVVDLFARFPSAAIDLGSVSFPTVVALYGLIFGATIWAKLPSDRRPSLPAPSLLAMFATSLVLVVLAWKAVADRPDGRLHLTTFESGGTLIETATGRFILIGGGNSATALSNSLGRRLPLFHRRLDWLIIPDREVSGLAGVPARIEIGALMLDGDQSDRALANLIQAMQSRGTRLVRAERGMALDLGDGARLDLIDREQGNITLLLTSGKARIAFLPHTHSPQMLSQSALTGVVLSSSSSTRWLQDFEGLVAVIDGPNPLPANASQFTLLATDDRGWIELATDGERLWVWTERSGP
ncbi:MAG: ComEC/Rec2 family competence protein [Anaerolineales bacterium]